MRPSAHRNGVSRLGWGLSPGLLLCLCGPPHAALSLRESCPTPAERFSSRPSPCINPPPHTPGPRQSLCREPPSRLIEIAACPRVYTDGFRQNNEVHPRTDS